MKSDELCAMVLTMGVIAWCISSGYAAQNKTTADQKTVAQKKTAVDKGKKSAASAATPAPAVTNAAQEPQTATAHPAVSFKATGTVADCDLKNSRITVQLNPTTTLMFIIDKATALTAGTKNIKLAEIKKGNKVVVGFTPGKGDHTAQFVTVQTTPIVSPGAPAQKKK